jgi:pyrimidine operon attenuation protein/uracil phosphoribosyltransferase
MNKKIMDSKSFNNVLEELIQQFVKDHKLSLKNKTVGIVGIHTRGAILAKRIQERLTQKYHYSVEVGSLDITLYRDDVGEIAKQPLVKETDIPFSIDGKLILLVDDVLYTGRTIRSALDALLELGRPKAVRLAVAVDRGQRELPIEADYCAMRMRVEPDQSVQIQVKEIDNKDGIWILKGAKPLT